MSAPLALARERTDGDGEGEYAQGGERWLGKFAQCVKWSFCLRAARMAVEQER